MLELQKISNILKEAHYTINEKASRTAINDLVKRLPDRKQAFLDMGGRLYITTLPSTDKYQSIRQLLINENMSVQDRVRVDLCYLTQTKTVDIKYQSLNRSLERLNDYCLVAIEAEVRRINLINSSDLNESSKNFYKQEAHAKLMQAVNVYVDNVNSLGDYLNPNNAALVNTLSHAPSSIQTVAQENFSMVTTSTQPIITDNESQNNCSEIVEAGKNSFEEERKPRVYKIGEVHPDSMLSKIYDMFLKKK